MLLVVAGLWSQSSMESLVYCFLVGALSSDERKLRTRNGYPSSESLWGGYPGENSGTESSPNESDSQIMNEKMEPPIYNKQQHRSNNRQHHTENDEH
eukprot:scaffold19816_cov56-Cyclotella_meneghiniana.AAC.6